MRLLTLAGLFTLLTAVSAMAGPWPRGEGKLFVSVGYEGLVDLDRLPFLVIDHSGKLYAEFGTGPRTTIGFDFYGDPGGGHAAIAFARRTLTTPERQGQFALSLGLGTRTDATGSQALVMAGVSWGRGFASRWGDGWTTVDAQVRLWADGSMIKKLDATLGLKPTQGWMLIGQVQLADYPGADTTARIQATAVRRLNDRISLEMGVILGVMNDSAAGLTLGLWSEF